MKITLTKAGFIDQLGNLDPLYRGQEYIEQATRDWDQLTGGAQKADLYVRGFNTAFNCHMASVNQEGFFNTYLPIAAKSVR